MNGTEHRVLFIVVLMFFPERGLPMKSLKSLAPYTLAITHFGMAWLYLGLLIALIFEFSGQDLALNIVSAVGTMPPAYVLANALWIFGAIILIIPPLVDGIKILIVLEVFLGVSGGLSYWQPEIFWHKVACRIFFGILVFTYLWYAGLLNRKDYRILATGIELLGLGYAINSMELLTIGSTLLAISNWMAYKSSKQPILLPWTILNVAYSFTGMVILSCRYAS